MMLMTSHRDVTEKGVHFESLEQRQLLSVTPKLVSVPISAAALKADPSLSNYKMYDLQVTLDSGERWLSADLKAKLSKGSFYNTPKQGENFAQKNLWTLLPALEADTAVSASNFSRPIILGQYSPTKANGGVFTSNEVNVSWGALQDSGKGTFTIARLTVSKDAVATIAGQVASTHTASSQSKQFQFDLKGGTQQTYPYISGTAYEDRNSNGKLDKGEPALKDWKIYLDKNNNGKLDKGEKYRYTDASGKYTFDPLTPGKYVIRQVTPSGWRRTQPSKTVYNSEIKAGVNGTGKNWGNTQNAFLSGTLFEDKNKNKKLDGNEKRLSGWTVYIDSNNNGKRDKNEQIAGTDKNGYWVFKKLKKGTYNVRLEGKWGYKMSGAQGFSIKMAAGGQYTGRLFGVVRI